MKAKIHLIPTDKSSRLVKIKDNLFYTTTENIPGGNYQNIYIASDEEIREGDYAYHKVFKIGKIINIDGAECFVTTKRKTDDGSVTTPWKRNIPDIKKIILTTDVDLIKGGVQAIDDEFLEWFVQNPSCEEVVVGHGFIKLTETDNKGYWVSIPDEEFNMKKQEPKQEMRKVCKCKRAYENPLSKICSLCWNELYPNEKDEIKDEDLLEPKQKTLQEAAEIYSQGWGEDDDFKAFIAGAKWQAQRMYSEEEVFELLWKYETRKTSMVGYSNVKEWFEKYKNVGKQ